MGIYSIAVKQVKIASLGNVNRACRHKQSAEMGIYSIAVKQVKPAFREFVHVLVRYVTGRVANLVRCVVEVRVWIRPRP
jgi:hypothetical protein